MASGKAGAVSRRRRFHIALAAIVGVAALIRVSNLGTFSAWLDEILTLRLLDLAPGEVVHRLSEDAENSPLCVAVLWIFRRLGLDETSLRLVPIAAGLASIVLLAIWIRSRVGRDVALIAGAVCALSPFHVRYSQELRPYPFLLLAVTASLVAAEHLRRTPRPGAAVGLGLILAAGLWIHVSFALGVETVRHLRHGRPDWRPVARVVAETTRADEPVVAENPWSRIALQHDLADADRRPVALHAGAGRNILRQRGAVVVLGGYPSDPELRQAVRGRPRLLRDPDTATVVDARRDHPDDAILTP